MDITDNYIAEEVYTYRLSTNTLKNFMQSLHIILSTCRAGKLRDSGIES
jgi:hypothetical protein